MTASRLARVPALGQMQLEVPHHVDDFAAVLVREDVDAGAEQLHIAPAYTRRQERLLHVIRHRTE